MDKCRLDRSNAKTANCIIETEDGRKFTVSTIESRYDVRRLKEVRELIEKTFGKKELESKELLLAGIDGMSQWATPDAKYRIVTVYNEDNELVSLTTGAQLDLLDEQGKPTGDMVHYVMYAATDLEKRREGTALPAYTSALIDATKNAQEKGKTLKFAIGDCTNSSEKFWNKVGWKRIYQKNSEGNDIGETYTELKFIQPAFNFDPNTGEIAKGAGEVALHLMVDAFDEEAPNKQDIKRAYLAFMDYVVGLPPEAFNNPEAERVQKEYVSKIVNDFIGRLDMGGDLVFMDAKEREEAKKTGAVVYEHASNDHDKAGEEGF
jgi:hypothetical protein